MAEYIDTNLLIEKMSRLRGCSCSYSDGIIDEIEDIMSDISTEDVIIIPEGATREQVFKAVFGIEMMMAGLKNMDWWEEKYENKKNNKR